MADQVVIYNPAQQMFLNVSGQDHHGNRIIEAGAGVGLSAIFELRDGTVAGKVGIFNPDSQRWLTKTNELLNGDPMLEGLTNFAFASQLFGIRRAPFGDAYNIIADNGDYLFVSDDIIGGNVVEAHDDDSDERNAFLFFKFYVPPQDVVIDEKISVSLYSRERGKVIYISDELEGSDAYALGRDLSDYGKLFDYRIENWNDEIGKYTFFADTRYLQRSTLEVRGVSNLIVGGASGTEDVASFTLNPAPPAGVQLFSDAARLNVSITDVGYHIIGGNDELVALDRFGNIFILLQRYDPRF